MKLPTVALSLLWVSIALAPAHSATNEGPLGTCFAEQAKQVQFNGIIIAARDEQRLMRFVGFADAQNQIPIGPETRFRLASVGKLFTQVAIGQLIDQRKVSLNASVRTYLPELPESFAAITIDHLLNHRSGVASLTQRGPGHWSTISNAQTVGDLQRLVAARALEFRPGERQKYSNGGYYLLGAVIEVVTGTTYPQYIGEKIFVPLGMKSSGFDPGGATAVPLTRMPGPGQAPLAKPQPRLERMSPKPSPAGDAISTANDMEKFALALGGNRLVSDTTKAAIFPKRGDVWRIGQPGGSIGTNTSFYVMPDRKAHLIVLTNYDPPAGELMGQVLTQVLAGQACRPVNPADVPSPFIIRGGPQSPPPGPAKPPSHS